MNNRFKNLVLRKQPRDAEKGDAANGRWEAAKLTRSSRSSDFDVGLGVRGPLVQQSASCSPEDRPLQQDPNGSLKFKKRLK